MKKTFVRLYGFVEISSLRYGNPIIICSGILSRFVWKKETLLFYTFQPSQSQYTPKKNFTHLQDRFTNFQSHCSFALQTLKNSKLLFPELFSISSLKRYLVFSRFLHKLPGSVVVKVQQSQHDWGRKRCHTTVLQLMNDCYWRWWRKFIISPILVST